MEQAPDRTPSLFSRSSVKVVNPSNIPYFQPWPESRSGHHAPHRIDTWEYENTSPVLVCAFSFRLYAAERSGKTTPGQQHLSIPGLLQHRRRMRDRHRFPEDFEARWISFTADKDCSVTAWLEYK